MCSSRISTGLDPLRGKRRLRSAGDDVEQFFLASIALHEGAEDSFARLPLLEHYRTASVAEENAGGTVRVIGDAGKRLHADDKDLFRLP